MLAWQLPMRAAAYPIDTAERISMDALVQGIRLVVGLSMVAAGSAIVAPAGLSLFHALGHQAAPISAGPMPLESGRAPDVRTWPSIAESPLPAAPVTGGERLQYIPPPVPPQPLPPLPTALTAAGPDLAAGYRPTLQSPPPPLLDGQSPPPLAVGWTSRQPEPWAVRGMPMPPAPPTVADQARIYIVRDGDDLAGIATRFYGHPSGATAIWQANRGLLRDPGILPIGAALVLPPRAVVASLAQPADHAVIVPVTAGPSTLPTAGGPPSHPASWLTGGGATSPDRRSP